MNLSVFTGVGLVEPDPEPTVPAPGGVPLPATAAYRAAGFDPVALLGRRTARFNHRSTTLALAACGGALADAGIEVTDGNADGIGVTLGTTCGSLAGTVEFGWDTFAQERPHQVNPATFPNSVLNTAAGAAAIRFGLRGPNSTVAAGPLAGLAALRHAEVTLRAHHADTILVGAAEELSAPLAWVAETLRPGVVLGEGAAVLVLERPDVAAAGGRTPVARLAAVVSRAEDVRNPDTVAAAVTAALARAEAPPGRVRLLALRHTGDAVVDAAQVAGVGAVVSIEPTHVEDRIGDCASAHAAMQLAGVVRTIRAERWPAADVALVVAVDPDGALAVAVLSGPAGELS